MESETVQREATSGVELQRAKDGTYYWTIKRYYDASNKGEVDQALIEMQAIDKQLLQTYVHGTKDEGAPS